MRSEEIIKEFLSKNNVKINILTYLEVVEDSNYEIRPIDREIINHIIVDAYNGFSESVKTISNEITKKYNVFLGRKEKKIIKKALDYKLYDELNKISNIKDKITNEQLTNIVKKERIKNELIVNECKNEFINKLIEAIKTRNKKRITDYLNFLYSRLLKHNEFYERSINDIFCENKLYFDEGDYKKIFENCSSATEKTNYEIAVQNFNIIYQEKIIDNSEDLNEIVVIKIDQFLLRQFHLDPLNYQ